MPLFLVPIIDWRNTTRTTLDIENKERRYGATRRGLCVKAPDILTARALAFSYCHGLPGVVVVERRGVPVLTATAA